jgi:phosphatidylglycerol:prolipoprotein diacylglycerol transferase
MHPVGVVPAYVIGWCIAAVLGGASGFWLARRAGLRTAQIAVSFVAIAAAVFVGSKLLYVVEAWWTRAPNQFAQGFGSLQALRLPGGLLLALLIGPPLARYLGRSYLAIADAVVPMWGLVIVGIRIGCFLQGCCAGRPSSLPWAVQFPKWTESYWWQVKHGVIPRGAELPLPVHPLQLYFALAGLLIFLGLVAYQRHARYDGEVTLLFTLSFLWSTWGLELMRGEPHDMVRRLTFVAAVLVTGLAAVIEWRLRAARTHSTALPTPSAVGLT